MKLPLFNDSSGNPSLTTTAFVLGFVVAVLKLLISGLTIGSFKMDTFTGVDFAAVVGALGTVYAMRRNNSENKEDTE